MDIRWVVLLIINIALFASTSEAQTPCENYAFTNNNVYTACNALPFLNAFLHFTYHATNNTVDIAYRNTGLTTSHWVSWAINPTGAGMAGAQSLVAFHNSSGAVQAYTSPIAGYSTTMQEAPISFRVPRLAAEFRTGEMIIYATVQLQSGRSSYNHLWQFGTVSSGALTIHQQTPEHLRSSASIDFATGVSVDAGGGGAASRLRRRNVHGVLNAVSWGVMMPLGAVIARYLKVFKSANPAWFYLHVSCQSAAYIVGVAGWGTGLKLGSDSAGIEHTTHRNIGITLFALGTLQVFALLLRPNPTHKYRIYWSVYHHLVGYTVIVLSIVNIFEGFDILDPDRKWKRAYTGLIIAIGAVAVCLEAFTWFVVINRKKSDKQPHVANGVNGA